MPKRPCAPKVKHHTLEAALAARELIAATDHPARVARLGVYPCGVCSAAAGHRVWHVGHVTPQRYRQVRRP